MGGGSLVLSLLFHAILFAIAAMIASAIVQRPASVDFLPGGGSKAGAAASAQLAQNVRVTRRSALHKTPPRRKVVVENLMSAIALPDQINTTEIPRFSSRLGGGGMSGGFNKQGAGGGFGKGIGLGGMSAIAFGRSGRVAAILDMSRSMAPHLSRVVGELDRVAHGSPIVLYSGCGVGAPPPHLTLEHTPMEARQHTKSFEVFWRGAHRVRPPPPLPGMTAEPPKRHSFAPEPVPLAEVYTELVTRPSTFYVRYQGIGQAWISLLVEEVRHVETLYWFSDFQDPVDDRQLAAVLANLKRRKQRLFIHPAEKGPSFDRVRLLLALPSGGKVIENSD
jgi:hypothetical protein